MLVLKKITTKHTRGTRYFRFNIVLFVGSFVLLVVKKITTKNTKEHTRGTRYFRFNIVLFVGSLVLLVVKNNVY